MLRARSHWQRYGFALLTSAAALMLTLLLWPLIRPNSFLLFFAAVTLTAWLGGLGPTLFSTVFAVASQAYFFISPANSFAVTPGGAARLGVFAILAFAIGAVVDARRRAEAALRESNERVVNILDSITDGFVALDRKWRFTYLNRRATEILQRVRPTRDDLIGKSIWSEFREPERSVFYEQYRKAVNEQTPVKFEGFSPQLNAWFEVHAYPSADGLSVYFDDVTARKHADDERAKLLAREHAARTEAEATNRIKDEFLATLSHELRTPLSAILAWAGLLRSGKLDPTMTARALETIERNTRLQVQLIEDLLDVSRIITGKLRLEFRPVDLGTTVEAAIEAARPTAEAKGVTIRSAIRGRVPRVAGDADRLQQVVWNLLSNAVKFTPSGGHVDINVREQPGQMVITVSDTGQGIPPDFLPYVFERFRQADGTTTRAHRGLGLGLSIVRHLVELHGGTVGVDSAGEGQGAAFSVSLPLPPPDVQQLAERSATAAPAPPPPTHLVGIHILLVDDEVDAREYLTAVLAQYGAQVTAVGSTSDALATLDRLRPDVIVSDIGMPDEDGYALIRRLRVLETQRDGHLPALALTAYARDEDRERALHAGYQAHLAKPVETTALVATVRQLATTGVRMQRNSARQ